MPRPRVFLDSNVLFSGIHSSAGAPATILEQFIEGRLAVVISQQVLEEVIRTIKGKLPEALPVLKELLLSTSPEIRPSPTPEEVERWRGLLDAGDAAILAAAVTAQPDCLVTGDKHFVKNPEIAEKAGLRIVTPAQFIEAWAREQSHDQVG